MNKITRKTFYVILVSYIISLVVFAVYSYLTFPEKTILADFRVSWIRDNTLFLFIKSVIPVQCTAILVSYSLFSPVQNQKKRTIILEPFYKFVSSALLMFLALTLLYTIMNEAFLPSVYLRTHDMVNKSELTRKCLTDADNAKKSGDIEAEMVFLKLYLSIIPEDETIKARISKLDIQSGISKTQKKKEEQISEPRYKVINQNAAELIEKAQKYLKEKDYLSANYYAALAFQIDPSRTDAERIAAKAWESLLKIEPDKKEQELYDLYNRKIQGYKALTTNRPVKAYYIFESLMTDFPDDPDVKKYFSESLKAVSSETFFLDEIQTASAFAGTENIVFINQKEDTDTLTEIIYMDKLMTTRIGTYIQNLEAISLDSMGKIKHHLTAPYGKIIDNQILMHCIDRNNSDIFTTAVYLNETGLKKNILNLSPSTAEIKGFSFDKNHIKKISLPLLWTMKKTSDRYGYKKEPIEIEILDRLLLPFSFLILSFFSISIGWSLRTSGKRPKIFTYIFIPAFPFILNILIVLYLYAARVLSGFLLLYCGFSISIITLVILQMILLSAALLTIAGQSTD